jgi:hypothetical protein
MKFEKHLKPGERHTASTNPKGIIPEHDFDYLEKGAKSGPELWVSFLPVGFKNEQENTYDNFAKQLEPFFRKTIDFYTKQIRVPRRLYKVSNQLWDLSDIWQYYGPQGIDFYAMNPKPKGSVPKGTPTNKYCDLSPEEAYVRVALENFKSFKDFQKYYQTHEWMGEGWQKDSIFIDHMNKRLYDFVWVNVHSFEGGSLVSAGQAYNLTYAGLVMLMAGCSTGGFYQPGSPSFVDSKVPPSGNIMLAYLYGTSKAIAALGDPFNRGHESYFGELVSFMIKGDYLGKAHLKRTKIQYENSPDPGTLRENLMEILVGDPYMDIIE